MSEEKHMVAGEETPLAFVVPLTVGLLKPAVAALLVWLLEAPMGWREFAAVYLVALTACVLPYQRRAGDHLVRFDTTQGGTLFSVVSMLYNALLLVLLTILAMAVLGRLGL